MVSPVIHSVVSKVLTPQPVQPADGFLLLEDGFRMLLESDSFILLE